MSIEQKIAELLAESKKSTQQQEGVVDQIDEEIDLDEEQIDELNASTLSSYSGKASKDAEAMGKQSRSHASTAQKHGQISKLSRDLGNNRAANKHAKSASSELSKSSDLDAKLNKRLSNVNRANDKFSAKLGEDYVTEGLMDAIKSSFAKGMQDKIKSAVKPEHHKHYDFTAVKSLSDARGVISKAKEAGHIKEDLDSYDVYDISEDVDALVQGEDLSEEFKEKAATIFEAAILSRVKQEIAKLDESYQNKLDEQVEVIKEGLVEKVDGYLDYVVEQWMEQNEIALESGMKSEILEGFVGGLKGLFEDHYIDIPEEKFDVVGSLEEEADTLRAMLDEQLESNVGLKAELAKYQVKLVIDSLSEGLADTDKEKFHTLVEELDFDGLESFEKKVQTIRENYFTNKATTIVVESVITDTPITLTEQAIVRPEMRGYVSALNNLK